MTLPYTGIYAVDLSADIPVSVLEPMWVFKKKCQWLFVNVQAHEQANLFSKLKLCVQNLLNLQRMPKRFKNITLDMTFFLTTNINGLYNSYVELN